MSQTWLLLDHVSICLWLSDEPFFLRKLLDEVDLNMAPTGGKDKDKSVAWLFFFQKLDIRYLPLRKLLSLNWNVKPANDSSLIKILYLGQNSVAKRGYLSEENHYSSVLSVCLLLNTNYKQAGLGRIITDSLSQRRNRLLSTFQSGDDFEQTVIMHPELRFIEPIFDELKQSVQASITRTSRAPSNHNRETYVLARNRALVFSPPTTAREAPPSTTEHRRPSF